MAVISSVRSGCVDHTAAISSDAAARMLCTSGAKDEARERSESALSNVEKTDRCRNLSGQ
jgi:hypothetical protein